MTKRRGATQAAIQPSAYEPGFSALRWPAAALLAALGLLSWRLGMDGTSVQAALAHVGWCLGGGPAAVEAPQFFGHCAACYAGLAALLSAATLAFWPKTGGLRL